MSGPGLQLLRERNRALVSPHAYSQWAQGPQGALACLLPRLQATRLRTYQSCSNTVCSCVAIVASVRGLVAIMQAIKQHIFGRTVENIVASDRIAVQ